MIVIAVSVFFVSIQLSLCSLPLFHLVPLECLEVLGVVAAVSDGDLFVELQYVLPSAGVKGVHLLASFFALCPAVVGAVTAHSCVWFCSGIGVHYSQTAATFRHWFVVCSADGGVHLCTAATAVCVLAVPPRAFALVRFTGSGCGAPVQFGLFQGAPVLGAI